MENLQTKNVDIKELKDEKVIDLVVPMYKAKGTLLRLLSSVSMQTMKDNVHIILVQDADGEDYSDILSIFEKILDIEVVVLEENSGPGKTRRIGMKKGKSKYITCMDADDTFQNPFSLEELYKTIEEGEFDAVNSIFLEQLNGTNFVQHENDWIWTFGKMYRRSFLEENKIEMNDSRANEDTGFNTVVRLYGKIGYLPDITYIWHFKEDSITRRDNGIYRFTGLEGWLYNIKWSLSKLCDLKIDEKIIKERLAVTIINTYIWHNEFLNDEDERIDVEKYLMWVRDFVSDFYNLHFPSKDILQNVYNELGKNDRIVQNIPQFTLYEYMDMVGAKYE